LRKSPTLDDLDNFTSKLYVTPEDIYQIAPLTRKSTKDLVRKIVEEMEREGLPPISTKPVMVPTYRVMQRLGLNERSRNGK